MELYWITIGEWSVLGKLARTYRKRYGDDINAVIAGIIYKRRDRFTTFDEVVREDTGENIDSAMLALMRASFTNHIEDDDYQLLGKDKITGKNGERAIGYAETMFTYAPATSIGVGGAEGFLRVICPINIVNRQMLLDLMTCEEAAEILTGFKTIADYNHDVSENILAPIIIDQYDEETHGEELITRLFQSVRPAEHFIVTMHHLVMARLLSDSDIVEIINNSIRYIDRVKRQIKDNPNLPPEKRKVIADYWLRRYISVLLYNLPIHAHLNRRIDIDGKERSVADAVADYGTEYEVNLAQVEKFCRERELVPAHKRFSNAADFMAYVEKLDISEDVDKEFAHYALKQVMASLTDKDLAKHGKMTINGLDAVLTGMILEADKSADLSHFWVGRHTDISIVPSGYKDLSLEDNHLHNILNKAMLENLKTPREPVKISAPKIAAAIYKTLTELPFIMCSISRMQSLTAYLERQPDKDLRDYLLPKVKKITSLFESKGKAQEILDRLVDDLRKRSAAAYAK